MSPESSGETTLIGRVISDRFRIIQRLAAGGMGAVYLAEQVPLGRKVALKVLEPASENRGRLQFEERFFLEAAAVAKLSHPNTIVLYDYGRTEDGHFFFAMELVEGSTLSQLIHQHRALQAGIAVHIGAQICSSLREAHGAGLVHRDLKPGNVMLAQRGDDPYFVKVLDFGLVKVLGEEGNSELTRSGIVMGSPRYMAPEQVQQRPVDHRADIYAFGAVLYHMLAGAAPFEYESTFETLRAQVDHAPPPLTAKNPWCDAGPRLTALVFRCLAKDPAHRPQSMAELAAELRACAMEAGMSMPSLALSGAVPLEHISVTVSGEASVPASGVHSSMHSVATPLGQQPIPQEAPRHTALWIVSIFFIVCVGAAAGAAAFLIPGSEPAHRTRHERAPQPPVQHVVTPPAPPVGQRPALSPTEVLSEPPGAHVRRGDEDLGDAPVSLLVPEGERWQLTLSLEGHQPRTISLTSGQPQVRVSLVPIAAPHVGTRVPRHNVVQQPQQQQQIRQQPVQAPVWSRSENRDPWGGH